MAGRPARMRPLPLHLPMGNGEPAYALLERLALRYGAGSPAAFAAANGLKWGSVVAGRDTDGVAALAGVDAGALRAATFVAEGGLVRLGGETIARTDWSPPARRRCRACEAEDEALLDRPAPRAFRRAWWDIRSLRRCPWHGSDLTASTPGSAGSPEAVTPIDGEGFPGETYVLGRLGFARLRRVALLDELTLAAAIPLVERVGAMRLHGRRARSDAKLVDPRPLLSAGMAAFEGGPSPFHSFLDGLVATARPDRDELTPGAAYGRLYGWLVHDERDPTYGPVREVLRAHAIASLPLSPGRVLLGRPVAAPLLGTVAGLSRATGLEKATVERFLALIGAVPAPGPSPIPLYAAADCARVASLAAASCWSWEARRALGLTNEGMGSLVSAGCLVPILPRRGREAREDRFDRADVERLALGLSDGVRRLRAVPSDCALLPQAARRGMSSIGLIVRALVDGRLVPRGRLPGRPGLSGLVLKVDDVLSLHRARTDDVPWSEVVSGIGDARLARSLVASGRLRLRRAPCGFRNRHRREVPRADWSEFSRGFVSAGELARSSGTSAAAVARRLSRSGIGPAFASASPGGPTFYRREDLASLRPGTRASRGDRRSRSRRGVTLGSATRQSEEVGTDRFPGVVGRAVS